MHHLTFYVCMVTHIARVCIVPISLRGLGRDIPLLVSNCFVEKSLLMLSSCQINCHRLQRTPTVTVFIESFHLEGSCVY